MTVLTPATPNNTAHHMARIFEPIVFVHHLFSLAAAAPQRINTATNPAQIILPSATTFPPLKRASPVGCESSRWPTITAVPDSRMASPCSAHPSNTRPPPNQDRQHYRENGNAPARTQARSPTKTLLMTVIATLRMIQAE